MVKILNTEVILIKKFLIVIFIFVMALMMYIMFFLSEEELPPPKVYISGTSIVYDGDLSPEGIEMAKTLYSKKIENLILNSLGGEINLGMDLGEWVYEKKLNVIVKYAVFSSAANYVFPAGRKKFLYKDSFIGWHGGAAQTPETLYEKAFTKFFLNSYMTKAKNRERDFFKKINVNPKITILGQQDIYKQYNKDYRGWTYSLEALDELGVKDIILLDGTWDPITEFKKSQIFIIESIK